MSDYQYDKYKVVVLSSRQSQIPFDTKTLQITLICRVLFFHCCSQFLFSLFTTEGIRQPFGSAKRPEGKRNPNRKRKRKCPSTPFDSPSTSPWTGCLGWDLDWRNL